MENINKQPYLIFIAIIISGLLVAGAIVWKKDSSQNSLQPASSAKIETDKKTEGVQNAAKNLNPEGEGDDPVLGSPEAPLTMVIFADFQCPFCKNFETETRPLIVEKYVKTGKVQIIERDFAFLGKESVWAAEAANCAFEQNKYWEYSDSLYLNQKKIDFSKENLKSFAQKLNLDSEQFNECLDSDKYLDEVKKDFEAGQALGVTGTPTSFINKEVLSGALPFEEFEKTIETELKIENSR